METPIFRTLAISGALFALVGSAHAEDSIIVATAGKPTGVVTAELYQAAIAVCNSQPARLDNEGCAETSLDNALLQFRQLRKAEAASLPAASAR